MAESGIYWKLGWVICRKWVGSWFIQEPWQLVERRLSYPRIPFSYWIED